MSSIDAASLAGTWISSSLAIIALIGIIGPFYALKTAYGTKTRVLNGVWDENRTYLTKGWAIGNSPALFRRSQVPNLARNYQNNNYGVAPILPDGEDPASYQYLQRQVDFSSWNTGWARLCALIQSHHKSPQYDDAGMCAGSTDGKLEIINSFSALVVSRYWIFFLGLLGVYGRKEEEKWPQLALRPDTGADHSGDAMSLQSHESFNFARQHPNYGNSTRYYRGFYSRHGVQMFSSSRGREIKGSSGNFKSLGRQKHSTGIHSLVAFQYAMQPRVSSVGVDEPSQHLPLTPNLQSRFWFAFGYLPGRTGLPISYLDPIDPRLTASNAFPGAGEGLTLYFSLGMSSALPILLEHCSDALKIRHGAEVLQWESSSRSRQIASEWHTVTQHSQSPAIFLWKPDIVKALDAFLHINYDELLRFNDSTMRSFSCEPVSEFLDMFRESRRHHNEQNDAPEQRAEIQIKTVPAWNFQNHQYFPSKIKDLTQFENYLFELIKDCGIDVISYPIAIAFILDKDFRKDLTNTLTQPDEGSIKQDIPSEDLPNDSIRDGEGSISQASSSQNESTSNHSAPRN
ncbi:hypothetical protein K456DRAFT_1764696 [Colletotrichum gloeosporioides 23]|nr:hypothetical protein K456DRAFT_1764696 [Colletotrichum gloeosporioides 23]